MNPSLEKFAGPLEELLGRRTALAAAAGSAPDEGSNPSAEAIDKHWRELLDVLAAAVYLTDAAGKLVYFNSAAADLWGHVPVLGTSQWCGSWRLYWPDGTPMPHDACPMAVALKERHAIRGAEAIAERPDGTRVSFLAYPTPLWNDHGEMVGGINLLVDISARKRAEQADQLLAAIVESSDDAIVSKDLEGVVASWNKGAERLFGYSAEEMIGRPIAILIPPDRQDEEPRILGRIRRGERVDTYETVRVRKDGRMVDVALTISPVKNAEGRIIGASKIAHDITERKRAVEHQNLLVREIKHRIKNSLATVQAIARQTLKSASRQEVDAFVGRLQALAAAHDLLTTENWGRAPLDELVGQSLHAFDEIGEDRFVIEGPSGVWIDAERCARLTMVLHELATNAIKHGALSNADGKVAVTWDTWNADDGRRLRLHWQEKGGPRVTKPERTGFGSSLIARALQSESSTVTVDYDPAGLRVTFDLPL